MSAQPHLKFSGFYLELLLNVRPAGGHLYGKQLFTWLSLVVSLMAAFCSDVLNEIRDLIESVSKGFLTYSGVVGWF